MSSPDLAGGEAIGAVVVAARRSRLARCSLAWEAGGHSLVIFNYSAVLLGEPHWVARSVAFSRQREDKEDSHVYNVLGLTDPAS